MSRTIRNYNVNVLEWEKPWHATGDHNGKFFSVGKKKCLKKQNSGVHRANERSMLAKIKSDFEHAESAIFVNYSMSVDPWDIDWFRD